MNTLLSVLASKGNTYCTRENITPRGQSEIKRMAKGVSGKQNEIVMQSAAQAIINSSKSYGEALRQKRIENQNNALNVQKQKYHYKNMSSNIVRCKTSTSARQVVSQAKRELQKLKKAKASGKYDNEEIDAAIAHAKSMERIARKKARHLEEEELAKASKMGKVEEFVEKEGKKAENEEEVDSEDKAAEEEAAFEEENPQDTVSGEISPQEYYDSVEYFAQSAQFEEFALQMEDMTAEMLDEMETSMEEMMEDLGLEELSESLLAATGKMDDNDIKMMEIVHRNKEMKELTKANMDYLKAIFEHYESLKDSATSAPIQASAAPPAATPVSATPTAMPVATPTIDIAL